MKNLTKTNKESAYKIKFVDLFFLSLGGQSPFLSILTYGIGAFLLAGSFGAIAIILGTLLVAIDGLVVTSLARRFSETGGYYIYAMRSINKGVGFITGWLYILFSILYGVAYVLGSSFILFEAFDFNPFYGAMLVFFPAAIFAILGIRPTLKYAVVAAIVELAALISIFLFFLYSANFSLYVPKPYGINLYDIALVVLIASSIPIGYDAIAPMGGESERPKITISKAVLLVILVGGFLAALNIYAITDYIIFSNLQVQLTSIIDIISEKFGILAILFVLFAAMNDGILATLSFIISASRTLYAMANYKSLPSYFSNFKIGKGPFNAILFSCTVYFSVLILSLYLFKNPFDSFLHIAVISLLSYYCVHLLANFSLFKISFVRLNKRFFEFLLSIIATIATVAEIIFVLPSAPISTVAIFFAWVIAGMIYFYFKK